ncbi:bifunctional phosphoribosylaminoimidazolecarboxamide formyltransferase/IMP cyclohydrolase [Aeoliella mucimassa]|uniref:Bifunctional purine biosynthesis protein PurH n=1 Tax=Aeoliella mucimassa TaxID=2527972 RepID=A0A518ATN9_9BACT|nr:bifunctional phosphoribosylaminoimidazolecarboxamide formyltransferase/IMP cyclohydrolase [Aeoliella mucimassa]QDU58065.1 Bifunctional purine biosynthesis protein PurH [Aeoliella mucimassa]
MTSSKIERALLSVSDKTGLVEFAKGLVAAGVSLYSTGGTRKALETAGIEVQDVAAYTGSPEMMDGRVKTLHPKVHGGILCRHDHTGDQKSLEDHEIARFELVVVNLYPFSQTVAKSETTFAEAIEQIDIGGPSMVRSAAKNHAFVTIASNPQQYSEILSAIQQQGGTTPEQRRQLAAEAFAHTADYDAGIAKYFAKQTETESGDFTSTIRLNLSRTLPLRYGENPHQCAALYKLADAGPHSVVNAEQLNGKELSYNNLLDLDAALGVARSLPTPGVAVLKHNNPCGAASASTLGEAMQKAWAGDPISAFGSILGFNVPVDAAAAECLAEPGKFVEAIVAPDYTPEALEILTTKPKWKANVRLMKIGQLEPGTGAIQLRSIDGGYLAQTADDKPDDETEWKIVTETTPTDTQMADLRFAWAVCRHVKSNAIVLAKDEMLLGAGAGQMSRVDSVEISISKAGDRVTGSVLASDAFFPFDDSIHRAAEAGITAIIQPGGSRNDEQVIAACNKHGLPMVFTNCRHFRH